MEMNQFDELTRHVSNAGSSRRQALRALGSVLLGGALGGVAARLGLADVATATSKKKTKRKPQAERKAQGQLQAEGKRKGKRRHKKPKAPVECDEFPVPLCGRCEEAVCAAGNWVCRSNGERDCGGGVCVAANACCPGERDCEGDGSACAKPGECCPAEQKCGNECYPKDGCCPGQKKCPGYAECFAAEDCCPNALPPLCAACDKVVCEDGELVCRPKSKDCPYPQDQKVCCNGDLVCRYSSDEPSCAGLPWLSYNPAICRCECPTGSHQTGMYCCPLDYPLLDPQGTPTCCRPDNCNDNVCAIGFSRVGGTGPCRRTT